MALEFRGRIDRRLSVVLTSLFVLVVLVGGASLALLGSLLLRSETIARESEQLDLAERVHRTLHRFFSAIERAQQEGRAVSDSLSVRYAGDLEVLVTRYAAAGGAARDVEEIRDIIAATTRLAGGAVWPPRADRPSPGPFSRPAADGFEATEQRIEALTDRISAGHGATEHAQVQQTRQRLSITIAMNLAFVALGALLVLGSQQYLQRRISGPLRRLAERSGEIARGELARPMPVTSTDEIGRLSHAFNHMTRQLKRHEERLKGLVTLAERQRLARELHDSLAQDLAVLRLKLLEADRSLGSSPPTETRRVVSEMVAMVDDAHRHVREAILGLHALEPAVPLVPALRSHLDDWSRLRGLPVELQAPEADLLALPAFAETQVVRIVHEALTNVARHARATRAVVKADIEGATVHITIEDDGQGFIVEDAADARLHVGLRTMKERAEAVGGTLVIESAPGQGTRVNVRVPRGPR
jgi:signal transduction histidine kinase